MEQLKRCPLCKGEAEVYEYESSRDIYDGQTLGYVDTEYFTMYGVGCHECGCIIAEHASKESAIAAWNTRKPMERILERLERLKNYEASGDCPKDGMCSKKPYECTSCYTTTAIEIIKEEMETNAD